MYFNRDLGSTDDVKLDTVPLYEKKTFRRREIVSNWSRYTLPEESENQPQAKGEDFSIVLNAAGGAQAQFRFKDEQDWESDVPCLTDTSNILSLDCDMLAVAIQCIPVHERLGLDEELFSKDQVDVFHQEADRFQKFYKQLPATNGENHDTENLTSVPRLKISERETNTTDTSDSKPVLYSDRSGGENIVLTNSLKTNTVTKENIGVILSDSDKHVNRDIEALSTDRDHVSEKGTEHRQLYKSVNKVKPSKTECADDELDFLLSMETPQSRRTEISVSSDRHLESAKEKQLQLEMKSDEPVLTALSNSQQSKPSTKSGDEESLEDWLDSVLDN
ncbi:cell death regulator Aven-like isoform X2 [Gigantopelta aegis]|uniref:cell death regulator Aven-like isoform X2 n=1 Tax=Gigantopelta aegis TaxID=1735272 RepID=UPI001B88B8E8|nr:cell death regulator Aven-like isoform X2 [Gigantopelta aegis]